MIPRSNGLGAGAGIAEYFMRSVAESKALATATYEVGVAVLLLDLNRFKHVNDTLDHPVGDRLLKVVAERLRRAVRAGDMVARLGGDEFSVVLTSTDARVEPAAVARRIHEALTEQFLLEDHSLRIGTSIGIALSSPDADAERLIKEADVALYQAKAGGGDGVCFFT